MKSYKHHLLSFLLILLLHASASATALDDYIDIAEPNYGWVQSGSDSFDLGTMTRGYVLKLNSLTWRSTDEVDHVDWEHWVTIIIPEWDWLLGSTKDTAMILIDGGDYDEAAPSASEIDSTFRSMAAGTRSVIVLLSAVPNQPLYFTDEAIGRTEDEIIAYSWDKFFNGGDANWPVQLPMTKSVVMCMDAVDDFVENHANDTKTINHFVLAGGSKRGWTAWLTAAVDMRVTAIAPIVSDLLNLKRSFSHHWASYGFWADAIAPYEEMGIFDWLDTPESNDLLAIVDPHEYLDRLDLPKFLINASGDQFFVMDSSQFYFNELLGETYLRMVPNTDHYLTDAFDDIYSRTVPFYFDFLNGNPRPQFDWTFETDGSIRVETTDPPLAVKLYQAANPNDRDFRMLTIGQTWTDSSLPDSGGGVYIGKIDEPNEGWAAFFVELTYDNEFSQEYSTADEFQYHFTTEMRVLPELLPFEADFDRNRITDACDLFIFADSWLTSNVYRDIAPRRGGDDYIDLLDFSIFASHWAEDQSLP